MLSFNAETQIETPEAKRPFGGPAGGFKLRIALLFSDLAAPSFCMSSFE